MLVQPDGPIPNSYWVESGRLLAGGYPGSLGEEHACQKVRRFLRAGVTFFLNLTEEGEVEPYERFLHSDALALGGSVEHHRMPIEDMNTPTEHEMVEILDMVDTALATAHTVYIHCWGGMGRTGTVVGCYLARHGMSGEQALEKIAQMRRGTPKGKYTSPETEAQKQMVLNWGRK